ncbi:hypothetical protein VNI00_017574 [Paramarasmius palmivorus]|uniref:Uncharacterized protein n=1 Tax=Paramarasmius palmivorus TaxID=297713 RepID=A0AAW0B5E7_9AGAR
MPWFINKQGHLVGEILEVNKEQNCAILQISDSANVALTHDADWDLWSTLTKYITTIGKVIDKEMMYLDSFINMGKTVNLGTVKETIKIIHDPRFHILSL